MVLSGLSGITWSESTELVLYELFTLPATRKRFRNGSHALGSFHIKSLSFVTVPSLNFKPKSRRISSHERIHSIPFFSPNVFTNDTSEDFHNGFARTSLRGSPISLSFHPTLISHCYVCSKLLDPSPHDWRYLGLHLKQTSVVLSLRRLRVI